jgi:hypothetical protein
VIERFKNVMRDGASGLNGAIHGTKGNTMRNAWVRGMTVGVLAGLAGAAEARPPERVASGLWPTPVAPAPETPKPEPAPAPAPVTRPAPVPRPAPTRTPAAPRQAVPAPARGTDAGPARRSLFIGVERLFGASRADWANDRSEDFYASERTVSGLAVVGLDQPLRVGLDLALGPHATLGGVIGFGTRTQANDVDGVRDARPETMKSLVVGARAGLVMPAGPVVELWLRFGFSHIRLTEESESEVERDQERLAVTDLNVEATLLLKPAPGWAITLGAYLDKSLSGELRYLNDDFRDDRADAISTTDLDRTGYGAALGLVTWL